MLQPPGQQHATSIKLLAGKTQKGTGEQEIFLQGLEHQGGTDYPAYTSQQLTLPTFPSLNSPCKQGFPSDNLVLSIMTIALPRTLRRGALQPGYQALWC